MTRSFGVLLGPFLLWEYLRQRQCRLKALNSFQSIFSILRSLDLRILWFALIPAGLAVFMWVCWQVTDNPLAFIEIQDAWRGDQNKYSNPLAVIAWGLARIGIYSDIRQAIWAYGKVFGVLTAIATAAVVIHGRRRIDSALTIWSLTTILLYLCTGNVALGSMQRYLVTIFPQYMILAQYRFGKLSLFIISCAGALIQAITMSFWTNGFHFAV